MLDQNTDRMWYVIGVALVSIFVLVFINDVFPDVFAGAMDGAKDKTVVEYVEPEPGVTVVEIPYDIEYTTDPTKVKDGVNGVKNVFDNGTPDEIVKEPINRVALYPYEEQEVAFSTRYVDNPDKPQGYSNVTQEGKVGYDYYFINPETSERVSKYDALTKPPVDKVIERGTAPISTIPFKTRYTFDRTQVQEGVNGEKYTDSKGKDHIIKEAVDKVVLYSTRVETIPFQTTRRENRDLPEGEERVVQAGSVGQKTVHYHPDTNAVVKEVVTTQPVDKIIEYGTLQTTTIAFKTEYTMDDKQIRKGQLGQKYVYSDGSEKVVKQPVSEIKKYPYHTRAIPHAAVHRESTNRLTTEKVTVQSGINGTKRVYYDPTTGSEIGAEEIIQQSRDEIIESGLIDPYWYNGRQLKFAYTAEWLQSYGKPSWDAAKDGAEQVARHTILGSILERIAVDDGYQYKYRRSDGTIRYITASSNYIRVGARLESRVNGLPFYTDSNLTKAYATIDVGAGFEEVVSLKKNGKGQYVYEMRNAVDRAGQTTYNGTYYVTADTTKVRIVNPDNFTEARAGIQYQVKSGDTLWGIANSNNVTVDQIKAWNNMTSADIRIGEWLIVGYK